MLEPNKSIRLGVEGSGTSVQGRTGSAQSDGDLNRVTKRKYAALDGPLSPPAAKRRRRTQSTEAEPTDTIDPMKTTSKLLNLPTEVLLNVLSFLPADAAAQFARLNSVSRQIAYAPESPLAGSVVWRSICELLPSPGSASSARLAAILFPQVQRPRSTDNPYRYLPNGLKLWECYYASVLSLPHVASPLDEYLSVPDEQTLVERALRLSHAAVAVPANSLGVHLDSTQASHQLLLQGHRFVACALRPYLLAHSPRYAQAEAIVGPWRAGCLLAGNYPDDYPSPTNPLASATESPWDAQAPLPTDEQGYIVPGRYAGLAEYAQKGSLTVLQALQLAGCAKSSLPAFDIPFESAAEAMQLLMIQSRYLMRGYEYERLRLQLPEVEDPLEGDFEVAMESVHTHPALSQRDRQKLNAAFVQLFIQRVPLNEATPDVQSMFEEASFLSECISKQGLEYLCYLTQPKVQPHLWEAVERIQASIRSATPCLVETGAMHALML